jgi:NitT/TauT family transport system permease protein/taurine transport system permease protein
VIARLRLGFHPAIPVVALILLGWYVVPGATHVPRYLFPPLSDVVSDFARLLADGTVLSQAAASLGRYVIAVALGTALGILVGFTLASSERAVRFFEPVLAFVQSIAGIAWIPLAIIWFGIGDAPLVFVVTNAVFFVVLANTAIGAQTVPRQYKDAVRTLGGSRWDVYRQVVLPGALASILVGMRLAVGFGWQSMVAAEVIAGGSGLGYLATSAGQRFDGATVVVAILSIGCLGFLINQLALRPLEIRTIERWGVVRAQ